MTTDRNIVGGVLLVGMSLVGWLAVYAITELVELRHKYYVHLLEDHRCP